MSREQVFQAEGTAWLRDQVRESVLHGHGETHCEILDQSSGRGGRGDSRTPRQEKPQPAPDVLCGGSLGFDQRARRSP